MAKALSAQSLGPVQQPRYLQLARSMRADIDGGGLTVGDRLPGERQICSRFQVSRTTVRRALEELQAQGYVQPDGTRGWFVTALVEPNTLLGLSDLAGQRGLVSTSRVIRRQLREATLAEAEALKAPAGAEIFELERVRLIGGSPVGWQSTIVAAWLAPGVGTHDYRSESLYAVLRQQGIVPTHADYDVRAAAATRPQSKLLELDPGTPVLIISAITSDQERRRIELSDGVFPGQRYRFTSVVSATTGVTPPVSP